MRFILNMFLVVCAIFAVLVAALVWHLKERKEASKPYISYTGLVTLANGCGDYKKQYGVFPEKMEQLRGFRPDMVASTTDAYGHSVILVPYNESVGYGELISYGRDGKPGGENQFDRDIVIRFPTDTETNTQWNKQIAERFKSRASRGL